MGSYNLDELITLWEREKLTSEQAIGQMLLLMQSLNRRIRELERRWWKQDQTNNTSKS